MKNWQSILLSPDMSLTEAILIIEAGKIQIALVADHSDRLLGVVSDGDIRRAIINNKSLDVKCSEIMNPQPTTALIGTRNEKLLTIMRINTIQQVPLVDGNGILRGIATLDEIHKIDDSDNWVVLMVGGLGTRLHPLTLECPKPLLEVGDRPVLEIIITDFIKQGFNKFFLAVNYKAKMIIDYFGDGSDWGVEINYLHETKRLGTAGSLSLLPEKPENSVIVMNGDLLTHADFKDIIRFHKKNQAAATVVAHLYEYTIPYGVINVDGECVKSIEEKPTNQHLVSTGIYVLSPDSLDYVGKNEFLDMPNLLSRLMDSEANIAAYRFKNFLLDIGRIDELNHAQLVWKTV